MAIRSEQLASGVGFLPMSDKRFKTIRLTAALYLPLSGQTAAAFAVLPDLLTRCCARYPDMILLNRRLNRLYGASLSGGVFRIGEHQVLTLTISCIDNRFALAGEDIADAAGEMLLELLFSPHLSADGLFDPEDFEQEKRCLCERIAAEINDKRLYARQQSDRLLAGEESFGVPVCGTIDAAQRLTREEVTAAWRTALQTAVFQFLYVAPDDGQKTADRIRAAFAGRARAPFAGRTLTDFAPLPSPRRKTEQMAVNQAKLVMGFRMRAQEPDEHAVAAGRLFTALFGGGPQSLLFRHVREKMSLCYYCHATLERYKGVLTVDSGVDAANAVTAEAAIMQQLTRICRGDFSGEMLEASRRSLINQIRDYENLQSSMVSWYRGQALLPHFTTPKEAIAALTAVDGDAVRRMAQTVSLVSVYTLLPEGGETP